MFNIWSYGTCYDYVLAVSQIHYIAIIFCSEQRDHLYTHGHVSESIKMSIACMYIHLEETIKIVVFDRWENNVKMVILILLVSFLAVSCGQQSSENGK